VIEPAWLFCQAAVGGLWYAEPNAISNAVDYAKFYSRSHAMIVRDFDEAGNVVATEEHAGDFREP
jgi:hypothetical protein